MGGSQSREDDEEDLEGPTGSSVDGRGPRLYERARLGDGQWPLVYSNSYNIGFMGLQRLHPFDSGKWGKVFAFLQEGGMIKGKDSVLEPREITRRELQLVHTENYLDSLNYSMNVALVVEVPPVAILPNSLVQSRLLRPLRYQTAGTIMAGKLAIERGWAINIGGGFHHCSSESGGGFCAYADITLAVKFMFNHLDGIKKAMIIDFDAHQGNGHERDFLGDDRVYIFDMYNSLIYPRDHGAKAAIRRKVELYHHTSDDVYLEHIRRGLPAALDEFDPDVVVYNAGTDILEGDRLGNMDITPEGVIERDRLVFTEVRKNRRKPIFMLTSGGYQVDVDFLEKQASEKRQREQEEKQRHEAFGQEMTRHDKVVELLQQRQEKDITQLNKSLTEYRKEHQRKADRSEFDLYDPDSKKKDKPARESDEDSRMTVSGMQTFAGEDLKYEKRKALQHEQIREWSSAQTEEKERLLSEQRHADRVYDMKACELDQRAVELACADADTRRNITTATKEYNLALAREKAAQRAQEMAREQDDNLTELCNHVNGDMLTENPAVAQSAFGTHRVIPDRWKGMGPEQVAGVRVTQEHQKLEKMAIESEVREREKEWNRRRIAEARAGLVLEAQLARRRKDEMKKLAQENRQLAEEQLARQRQLKGEVYTNKPSEGYFAQFNTTSR